MQQPEDIVWNAITESAKTRFDYEAFKESCGELGDANAIENILFMAIAGFAAGQSSGDIASEIRTQLLMIGFGFEESALEQFLEGKEAQLKNEIQATKMAMAFFEQGVDPLGVLVPVRSILNA